MLKALIIKLVAKLRSLLFSIKARHVNGSLQEYNIISSETFADALLLKSIARDLVLSIVANDFTARPAKIIMLFKDKYNFTVNEFFVLMFKLGMVTNSYVENSTELLEEALKLSDILDDEQIEVIHRMLDAQRDLNAQKLKEGYEAYKATQDIASRDETDPDVLIDNWLAKNKDNKDSTNKPS